jgi:hypothetical protein
MAVVKGIGSDDRQVAHVNDDSGRSDPRAGDATSSRAGRSDPPGDRVDRLARADQRLDVVAVGGADRAQRAPASECLQRAAEQHADAVLGMQVAVDRADL